MVPPDSEIVVPFFSIRSPAGIPPGHCSLTEPDKTIAENYDMLVSRTLVDSSDWSAEVLLINPGYDVVVLPAFSYTSDVVQVSAVWPKAAPHGPLPPHLEEIVTRSHPLGMDGHASLMDILHRYSHVFPALGNLVTSRTHVVRHEIITNDARPIRCGLCHLVPAGLRTEQDCVRDMLDRGQIEPSDSPWASPVVLVTKKDGSTHFCVDYPRLNVTIVKDVYLLFSIDDSLRLLGGQPWFPRWT